jgi:hypothetical protein
MLFLRISLPGLFLRRSLREETGDRIQEIGDGTRKLGKLLSPLSIGFRRNLSKQF